MAVFSAWAVLPVACVMAGRAKVLVASGFVVAEGHYPWLQTWPNILPEQRNHLSNPFGYPPTSSQLCHTACVCVSLSLSRSPSLALCLTLSLLSLTIPSSLNHPSLSHSLIIAVSSICLTLAPSVSLSPSFTISPFPLHHVSLPNSTPLSFSPLLSSLFPITVCLLNTLVAVEKSLRFY